MSRKSVREYVEAIRSRYLAANRKGKARILDEFCATAGAAEQRMHSI